MTPKIDRTQRGFAIANFVDHNGVEFSIQKSSLATEDCVWLGANKIGLKEFVSGRQPAWEDINLDDTDTHHCIANTRMYINREQAAMLAQFLQRFADTGEID